VGVGDPGRRHRASLQFKNQSWTWLSLDVFHRDGDLRVYLARIRVYEEADLEKVPATGLTPLLVNFMYKRRVGSCSSICA